MHRIWQTPWNLGNTPPRARHKRASALKYLYESATNFDQLSLGVFLIVKDVQFDRIEFMFRHLNYLLALGILLNFPSIKASTALEFDAVQNKVELIGPYIKYNFLKPPFSYSQFPFDKKSVSLNVMKNTDDALFVNSNWPSYFLSHGSVGIFNLENKKIFSQRFSEKSLKNRESLHTFDISANLHKFRKTMSEGVYFCIRDDLPSSKVEVCSDRLILKNGTFEAKEPSPDVRVLLNGKKIPTNAQVNLSETEDSYKLFVDFRSGLKITVTEQIDRVTPSQVFLDIKQRKVGIASQRQRFYKADLSFSEKIGKYLKEKNYFRESLTDRNDVKWPTSLTDVEMEFAPYPEAASTQLYALSFDEIPPKTFALQIDEKAPIATYKKTVVIKGYKSPDEKVYGLRKGSVKVSQDKTKFLWTFQSPEKGKANKDQIVYSPDGEEKFFFSRRVFRGHQASLSVSGAVGSSLDLSFVPGFKIDADFWPETIWNRHPFAFQRWGFVVSKVQTFSKFSIDGSDEKWSTDWLNIDIMGRFNPGVRPIESSFGMGLRYMQPSFQREFSSTLSPGLIGVGGFWHTGPQKIVDDVFNSVSFFRYPKWMEVSLFVYPFSITEGFTLGFSFSWSARGRLYFAQNWFMDASLNINSIQFQKVGDISANVGTAQGTLGLGYNF